MKPSEATKSIGVAVSGVLAWAAVVVASPSAAITASEWLMLGGVGASTLACFGLTNVTPAPASVPVPPTVSFVSSTPTPAVNSSPPAV